MILTQTMICTCILYNSKWNKEQQASNKIRKTNIEGADFIYDLRAEVEKFDII